MKAAKKWLNILIVVIMITASLRTIPNIIYFEEEIKKGVVFDTEYYSGIGHNNADNRYSILSKKNDKTYHHTTSEEKFDEYNINDSVTYRILHDGGGIWILTKNNEKMNGHLGKLKIASYHMLQRKLAIVPVGENNSGIENPESKLNGILPAIRY